MAYIPPDGSNVQFHFVTSGYVAPTGDTVNFNFTEEAGVRLHLGMSWITVAGTAQYPRLDQTYKVEARIQQGMRLNERYAIDSRQTAGMFLEHRWAVVSYLGAASRLTQRWATDASRFGSWRFTHQWATEASVAQMRLLQQWETKVNEKINVHLNNTFRAIGIKSGYGRLNHTWETQEAPHQKMTLTHRWVTLALQGRAMRQNMQWPSFAPVNAMFSHDNTWATLIYVSDYQRINLTWLDNFMVAKKLDILYNHRIANDLGIVYPLGRTVIAQALDVLYNITSRVAQDVELDSEIKTVDKVAKDIVLSHPIKDETPIQITNNPTVTINGNVLRLDAADVSFDEGQFAWTCDIVLFDPVHYALFNHDDTFVVDLLGESYTFIVDSKQFSRSGQVDISATISGISPSAVYADPRAKRVTKTWPAVLVTDVVQELFGVGVVDWQILDWALPAERLAVQDQAPMQILQTLAAAAGGLVESLPNGSIRVRYIYPVSVPAFSISTPDQEYNDNDHNFSLDERSPAFDLVNKLRIMDRAEDAQDIVEFEQDEFVSTKGIVKVWPQPWRDDVVVEHTSSGFVSTSPLGIVIEEFTETVEVVAGKGSLAHPIYEIDTVEWLFVNLTSVSFEQDSKEFSTTHPTLTESLVKITYRTRYYAFEAHSPEEEVQFLVKDPA